MAVKKKSAKRRSQPHRITYEQWMKKHPKTVFTHAPPVEVSRLETPDQLRFFNEEIANRLGIPPLQAQGDGTLTWCYSDSLPGSGRYVCDGDSES